MLYPESATKNDKQYNKIRMSPIPPPAYAKDMKALGGLYGWSHGRGLRQQMATEEDMTTQPCIWNPAPSKFLLLCRW